MSPSRKIGWVDVRKLSLEDWLAYLRRPEERRPEAFEDYRFPTAQHRDAFVAFTTAPILIYACFYVTFFWSAVV
jgi:hypothetical protein